MEFEVRDLPERSPSLGTKHLLRKLKWKLASQPPTESLVIVFEFLWNTWAQRHMDPFSLWTSLILLCDCHTSLFLVRSLVWTVHAHTKCKINIDWSMLVLGFFSIYKEYNEQICGNYKNYFKIFLFLLFMCMCLCGYISCKGMCRHQKRTTDPLEQTNGSLHAGAGDYWPISPAPYAILKNAKIQTEKKKPLLII